MRFLLIFLCFSQALYGQPLGLPEVPYPEDNPYTKEKEELGRMLYFDKRLSSNGTISCSSCHSIPKAFSDRSPISEGIFGHQGTRHAPTVINTAYLRKVFWDGRASSLEEQCKGPISNPNEMTSANNPKEAYRVCELAVEAIPGYRPLFKLAFGDDQVTIDRIVKAIATFERGILSGNSRYDRYMRANDKKALTEEEISGFNVFNRVGCAACHAGPNFTDGRFYNIGVGMDEKNPDVGRYGVTKNLKDFGAFKTPTLREVEHTYPYMHNGSLKTLEEVVDYYDKGGIPNPHLDPLMRPLNLSAQEKKALVSFLKALSGEGWQHIQEPLTFP